MTAGVRPVLGGGQHGVVVRVHVGSLQVTVISTFRHYLVGVSSVEFEVVAW